ncbi:MAG: ribonuclease D [Rickettsiales bacterium]|jgi:ribonuclease D
MSLITKQSDLNKICDSIEKAKITFIDTEFFREKTYFSILCLIQINVNGVCFAIDALEDFDFSPLVSILNNPAIIKIFHCLRQDLEVLSQSLPDKSMQEFDPKAMFDTQIMTAFCGLGFTISYGNLVNNLLDIEVSKDWQRSDWRKRPLHPDQIAYAKIDVLHLPKIYQILTQKLVDENKLEWAKKEMDDNVQKYLAEDDLLKNFSFSGKSAIYQKIIEALVIWRDCLARNLDVPRSFIIKDEIVSKIAFNNPKNIGELAKCGFKTRISKSDLKSEIINLILNQNKKLAHNPEHNSPQIALRLSEEQKETYQKSRELLESQAKKYQINPELIINQANLVKLILGSKLIENVLKDWRQDIFGEQLSKLIFTSEG